jgi:hypothetical protein
MRKFIKLTLLYLVAVTVLIFVLTFITEYVVNKKSSFKLNSSPKHLILGHSHPACAFNDSLIENTVNLSNPGESYFYTYFKAKQLIEDNPSIKVIFIEFTNNQINESMDNWIWGEAFMNDRYPKYSPFIEYNDKMILARNNFYDFSASISLSLKENSGRLLTQNYNYSKKIGGYRYLDRNKTDSLVKAVPDDNSYLKKIKISERNLEYLSKTIQLCQEQNKKVILIRSPLHDQYLGYTNEEVYQEIRKKRFNSIEYLDFSNFPLSNSEFGDLEHLNYKGAEKFSKWFSELINSNFLENPNKQRVIYEKMNNSTQDRIVIDPSD